MENRSTKELYLIEALRLFAEKGFDAVSVSEIAAAVGVTAPALYKHYKSKQALFDAIIELSNQGFSTRMGKLGVSFENDSDKQTAFFNLSEEEQIQMMQQLFLHTFLDEYPVLFRKLMTVEQFKRPSIAKLYNQRYVDAQYNAFEALMQDGIDMGFYEGGNAKAMAIQYISPVILLVGVCDREPDRKEEALELIADHIRQFNRIYLKKGKDNCFGQSEAPAAEDVPKKSM